MAAKKQAGNHSKELRTRAEQKVSSEDANTKKTLLPDQTSHMLHELQVHKIELEMQNDELLRVQGVLEVSQQRYFNLYELAPVGYLTLSEQGLILEANLTAANLLGLAKHKLAGQPLTRFMFSKDQDIYYLHLKQAFETGMPQAYVLRMGKKNGPQFWAQVDATAVRDPGGAPVFRVVMSDITERMEAQEKISRLTAGLEQKVLERTAELLEANKQLTLNQERLEALLTLFESGFSAKESSDFMLEQAVRLTESSYGFLSFISDDNTGMNIYSYSKDVLSNCDIGEPVRHFPLEKTGVWAHAVRDRKPLIINDYALSIPNKKGSPPGHVYLSRIMLVPQVDKGRVVAVAAVANKNKDYDESDVIQLRLLLDGLCSYTAQKNAEEAVLQSEKRYRSMLGAITTYTYTVEVAGGRDISTKYSIGCLPITGYRPEEYEANPLLWHSMIYPDDRAPVEAALRAIHAGSTMPPLEHRIIRRDGTVIWIRNTLVPRWNKNNVLMSYDGLIENITERKKAEEALVHSREHYRLVADFTYDWEFWMGPDGRFLYVSPSCESTTGYAAEEFMRDPGLYSRIIHPDDFEQMSAHIKDVTAQKDSAPIEYRIIRRDGELCWIAHVCQPVYDDGGTFLGRRGSNRDITRNRMLEKRVRHSERLASLGLLVSGIAHEINNPNNFITFNIPVLRDYLKAILPAVDEYSSARPDFSLFGMSYQEFKDDLYRLLDNMEHGSERINQTVSGLKEFIGNRGERELVWIDLHTLTNRVAMLCGSKVKKAVRSFTVLVNDDVPKLYTDPYALEHTLIILLVNASEAADKSDSYINLTVSRGAEWQEHVIIEVTDNGCGIAKENMARLFEPFFSTKSSAGGTGLGLYICRDMISGLSGRIDIESEPGKKTIVRLVLPDISGASKQ